MKVFVDPNEHFVIKIPEEWYVRNIEKDNELFKQPYGFEPYIDRNAAFQVSYKKITANTRKCNIENQPLGQCNLKYICSHVENIKTWVTNAESGYIVILSMVVDVEMDEKQKQMLFNQAQLSVDSFLILNQQAKKVLLPAIRWNNFMLSYFASIDLSNRALNNGSFVELVVLFANQIDAVLRQSITLAKQLKNESNEIDIGLIYQKENDRPIMEKKIYQLALDDDIIDQAIYSELINLYDVRNKVVHRYIISDLRSNEIIKLAKRYSEVYEILNEQVVQYEQRQYDEKIGIYNTSVRPGTNINDDYQKSLISSIRDKHGNREVNKAITISFKNVV